MTEPLLARLLEEEAQYLDAFRARMATTLSHIGDDLREGIGSALHTLVEENFASFNRTVGELLNQAADGLDDLIPDLGTTGGAVFGSVLTGVLGAVLGGKDIDARTLANRAVGAVLSENGTLKRKFSPSASQNAAQAAQNLGKSGRDA